jgi:hypothetical protein
VHRLRDREEAGDVRAEHQVAQVAVLDGRLVAAPVDAAHDLLEPGLGLREGPAVG